MFYMGYTHYFNFTKPVKINRIASLILADIVFGASEDGLIQLEYNLKGIPVCNDERIQFNGIGDDGYETFVINYKETDFGFCKTAQKPYDAIVTRVLLVLKYYYQDAFDLNSDGDLDDWQASIDYIKNTYDLDVKFFK